MKFLKENSILRGRSREFGMIVTPALLANLPIYSLAFSLGVLLSEDWDTLDLDLVLEARSNFSKAGKTLHTDHYYAFCEVFVRFFNSLDSVVRIKPSKTDYDSDVSEFLSDSQWVSSAFVGQAASKNSSSQVEVTVIEDFDF